MSTERIATMNVQGGLSDAVALAALDKVAPHADIIALQEWGPNRGDVIDRFTAERDDQWRYRKPARKCPPLLVRTAYTVLSAQAVTLHPGGYVGRIIGRRSVLPPVVAGLYRLREKATGDVVVVLNWHLPATVEARGVYRRVAAVLSPRARMHRRCKRKARRILKAERKTADRMYVTGDTNYHLMRFRTYISCWDGRKPKWTHGRRTIDAIYSAGPAHFVDTVNIGSDHKAVVVSYRI